MTTFYRLKEDGKILDYIEFEIATETKTEVVTEIEYKEVTVQKEVIEYREVLNENDEYEFQEVPVMQDILETIEVPVEKEVTVTIDHVPAFIREQYIETERKIIKLTDGSFAFEDEVNLEEEAKRKAEKEFNDAKNAKITELKNHRDTEEVTPILYNGNYFDYDEKARDRINAGIISLDILGEGATISWTTADNTEAIVSANDLRGVIGAVAYRSNELHVKYRALREQVDKATTIAEIEAIAW